MTHAPSSASADPITALHVHFAAAVAFLRAAPPPGLDAAQRLTRALLLEELEVYWSCANGTKARCDASVERA